MRINNCALLCAQLFKHFAPVYAAVDSFILPCLSTKTVPDTFYRLCESNDVGDKLIVLSNLVMRLKVTHCLNTIPEVYGHGKALEMRFTIKLTLYLIQNDVDAVY